MLLITLAIVIYFLYFCKFVFHFLQNFYVIHEKISNFVYFCMFLSVSIQKYFCSTVPAYILYRRYPFKYSQMKRQAKTPAYNHYYFKVKNSCPPQVYKYCKFSSNHFIFSGSACCLAAKKSAFSDSSSPHNTRSTASMVSSEMVTE